MRRAAFAIILSTCFVLAFLSACNPVWEMKIVERRYKVGGEVIPHKLGISIKLPDDMTADSISYDGKGGEITAVK